MLVRATNGLEAFRVRGNRQLEREDQKISE